MRRIYLQQIARVVHFNETSKKWRKSFNEIEITNLINTRKMLTIKNIWFWVNMELSWSTDFETKW